MEAFDDGWESESEDEPERLPTEIFIDYSKTIVSSNSSPDVPFHQSLNPYKGCEHGCVYCFARHTHEYLDLSLGQDFETKLFYKPNVLELLDRFFEKPGYRVEPITLGSNTDAYQPQEKSTKLTRRLLETFLCYRHPVSVMVSVTTLDSDLKRVMEPHAASPKMRLKVIRELSERGVNVGVLVAPVIPFINDNELEAIVSSCVEQGASSAGYVMLRLPHQIKDSFEEWLELHYPERKAWVLKVLREMHGGELYRSEWDSRMKGQRVTAELIKKRFEVVKRKCGSLRPSVISKS